MWTVYGERLIDDDFSGTPNVYQPFVLQKSLKLKALRTWFISHNNPTFTVLEMRIYESAGGGVPTAQLVECSNAWTLAELTSMDYGLKEIYFEFTNPIKLRRGTTYYLVPWVTGSSFTADSHLAWVRGFPDPNTSNTNYEASPNVARAPFYMGLIGAEYST